MLKMQKGGRKMEQTSTTLSPLAEAQYLALEFMRQKSLTDDSPADIAREYSMIRDQLYAALSQAGNA